MQVVSFQFFIRATKLLKFSDGFKPSNILLSHILLQWSFHINLSMTVFAGDKWSYKFPERLIWNKAFLSNTLNALSPDWDIFISLPLKQKWIFFRWSVPKLVSQTPAFIYLFPKFSVYKRDTVFSENHHF